MKKISKCSFCGCDNPRMKKPGNTTLYFKFCQEHQIKSVLSKQQAERTKDKQGLDNMRKKGTKTPQEEFYGSSAWYWCSKYVLLYYADDDLNVCCSTSPHLKYRITDKEIHCGHYLKSDQHKSTALEFVNLFPQSYSDNVHFSGKPEVAKHWIIKTHGLKVYNLLEKKKNEVYKLDQHEYKKWSDYYRNLFKLECKKRGISNPWKR